MAAHDPGKDILTPSNAAENIAAQELKEDDLKAVTGGLSSGMGANMSSVDTGVCVSSD
jgi:hypothetical protein